MCVQHFFYVLLVLYNIMKSFFIVSHMLLYNTILLLPTIQYEDYFHCELRNSLIQHYEDFCHMLH